MNHFRRNVGRRYWRQGLSLVELMMVIAIILLLMTMLLTVAGRMYKAVNSLKG